MYQNDDDDDDEDGDDSDDIFISLLLYSIFREDVVF